MIYVQKKRSKDGTKTYCCLVVDLGYTKKCLSYDIRDIAEYVGISVKDLMERVEIANDNAILYRSDFVLVEVL